MTVVNTDTRRVNRSRLSVLAIACAALGASLLPLSAGTASGAAPARVPVQRTGDVATKFTLSTFNVLGSSHTDPGGRHARMASGEKRTRLFVRWLDRHDVDVVGVQEMQINQYDEFVRVAGDRYGIQNAGYTRRGTQNSIVWRKDQWQKVEDGVLAENEIEDGAFTIKIPYFDAEWDMPYVHLEHLGTGQQSWFANFHNPATNKKRGNNAAKRREATKRQVKLVNDLLAEHRQPVFVTGDMNERETYFCRMVQGAPTKAANGGGFDKRGRCVPPPKPMPVNWIFGVKGGAVFSKYVRDDTHLVNRITDHFAVRADVRIRRAPASARR